MTPEEKAKEMVDKIQDGLWRDRAVKIYREDAVYAALILVDEIYKLNLKIGQHLEDFIDKENYYSYWEEVKTELENL